MPTCESIAATVVACMFFGAISDSLRTMSVLSARLDSLRGALQSVSVKVDRGDGTLGRRLKDGAETVNVLGEPVDFPDRPVESKERWPIHRPAPALVDQSTSPQILTTGIKVIDLICPFLKGGKVGAFGGAGVGKTVVITELISSIARVHKATNLPIFTHTGIPGKSALEQLDILEDGGVDPAHVVIGHDVPVRGHECAQVVSERDVHGRAVVQGPDADVENAPGRAGRLPAPGVGLRAPRLVARHSPRGGAAAVVRGHPGRPGPGPAARVRRAPPRDRL